MPQGECCYWVFLWSACAIIFISLLTFTLPSVRDQPSGVPGTLAVHTAAFVWLTLSWGRTILPRVNVYSIVTWLSIYLSALTVALIGGFGIATSARVALGQLLLPILAALSYRVLRQSATWTPPGPDSWRLRWRHNWAPSQLSDVFAMALAAVAAVLLITPLGVAPGLWLGAATFDQLAIWWQASTIAILSVAPILILLSADPDDLQQTNWYALTALVFATVGLFALIFQSGYLAYSWTILIPALIAGLVFRPWPAALHAAALLLGATRLGADPGFAASLGSSRLAVDTGVNALLGVATVSTLSVSLLQAEIRNQRSRASQRARMVSTLLEATGDAVVLCDDTGAIKFQNDAATALVGNKLGEPPPPSWAREFEMHWLDSTPVTDNELRDDTGRANSGEPLIIGGSKLDNPGARVATITHHRLLHDDDIRWAFFVHDASVQHSREEAMKSFASAAAHDLKGPLTAILGWLELAGEMTSDEDRALKRALERAHGSSQALRSTVDEWLHYSVVRQGRLDASPVELDDSVAAVTSVLELPDGSATITTDLQHSVHADANLLRKLFANLILNAIKYVEPGTKPQVHIRSRAYGSDEIRIDVIDNGIGVPLGSEESIFAPYSRGDAGASLEYEGNGLGLSLCRVIAEKHRGQIWARRNEAGGSTFSILMPAAVTRRSGGEGSNPSRLPPRQPTPRVGNTFPNRSAGVDELA